MDRGRIDLNGRSASAISFTMPANDVRLTANYLETDTVGSTYLVVDLETGLIHYTDTPPDLSDDTCRTTELWLRRIPAGAFTMGSPEDEIGHEGDETLHHVTLKSDYYMGIFEVTQKQYELVQGCNPSNYKGDCRPVECVSCIDIRGVEKTAGAGWPTGVDAVGADSFLGKLRARTGLTFDLPTEAQWEYACRAGSPAAFNTRKNLAAAEFDSAMNEAGRFWDNKSDGKGKYSEHAQVGSYLSNAWGLYDMHGNVFEWCLDWYGAYPSTSVTDPTGAQTGSERVLRGGSWNSFDVQYCRSANRSYSYPSCGSGSGFRVVCPP